MDTLAVLRQTFQPIIIGKFPTALCRHNMFFFRSLFYKASEM